MEKDTKTLQGQLIFLLEQQKFAALFKLVQQEMGTMGEFSALNKEFRISGIKDPNFSERVEVTICEKIPTKKKGISNFEEFMKKNRRRAFAKIDWKIKLFVPVSLSLLVLMPLCCTQINGDGNITNNKEATTKGGKSPIKQVDAQGNKGTMVINQNDGDVLEKSSKTVNNYYIEGSKSKSDTPTEAEKKKYAKPTVYEWKHTIGEGVSVQFDGMDKVFADKDGNVKINIPNPNFDKNYDLIFSKEGYKDIPKQMDIKNGAPLLNFEPKSE